MRPHVLTEDQFRRYLEEAVILDYLRNVSDLDVDITAADADEDLVEARKDLRFYILGLEQDTFDKFRGQSGAAAPLRFEGGGRLTNDVIRLDGYKEVTQEQVDSGTEPTYSDGTSYEVGVPNPEAMDDALTEAVRRTVADVAAHDTGLPPRHVKSKSQGNSSEEYDQVRRPSGLYRRLRRFDRRAIRI